MHLVLAALLALAPAPATVHVDDLGGILIVPVTINGKGPFHFVLDSGAGTTVVTPELAKKLQLRAAGNGVIGGMSDGQMTMQTLTLDRVSVGAASQSNVTAAAVPLPATLTNQGAYGTIDGILGYPFLRNYAVTLDIANRTAAFAAVSDFVAPANVSPVPLTLAEDALPIVEAMVDGARGRFEVDTGNNGAAVLTQAFSDAHGIAKSYASGSASHYTGVGGDARTERIRVATLTVGVATVHQPAVDVSSARKSTLQNNGLDGTVGYDFLRRFVVTIDYPGSKLYLSPNADADAYLAQTSTGVTIVRASDGTLAVQDVTPDSPAAQAGLVTGDVIVAINGTATPSMSIGDYRAALGEQPGKRVTYEVVSKSDRRRSVTLTTVDVLPPLR